MERLVRKGSTRVGQGARRLTSPAGGVIVTPARPCPAGRSTASGSARIEIMKSHRTLVVFAAAVAIALLLTPTSPAGAADTPRRGGILFGAIAADAPSLDPHQEETFATLHLVAPCYSTLLQIDPYSYPKIIGDLATDWKIAPDGLTYTFKL